MLDMKRTLVRAYPEIDQNSCSTQLRWKNNHEAVTKVPTLSLTGQ